jgi:hypothetical protein
MGRALIDLTPLRQTPSIEGWFPLLDEKGATPVPGKLYMRIAIERELVAQKDMKAEDFVKRRGSLMAAAEVKEEVDVEEKFDAIRVAVCSWNVGNAPPPDDLAPWIPKAGFDLIAIGTQECQYKERKGYSNCHEDWVQTCAKYLGMGVGRGKVVWGVSTKILICVLCVA